MTDLSPNMLLRAYAMGVFPMAQSRDAVEIHWIDPNERGVIPIDGFHISRSLRKRLLRDDYQVRLNFDFASTMAACAERDETWINDALRAAYVGLHAQGHAHSLEIWRDDEMIGGVYGVSLGAAFFGESMFSRRTDGSKMALAWLFAHLRAAGFKLFDAQFQTPHLASLGCIEISRGTYRKSLADALRSYAKINDLPPEISAKNLFD